MRRVFPLRKSMAVNMFAKLISEMIDVLEPGQVESMINENLTLMDIISDEIREMTLHGLSIADDRNIPLDKLETWFNEEFDVIVKKVYDKTKNLRYVNKNVPIVMDWITLNLEAWYNNVVKPLVKPP